MRRFSFLNLDKSAGEWYNNGEDSVCGINYNGTPCYFQKNLQGDIIAIVDASGAVVGKYFYDAWGKCTNITTLNADGTVSTSTTHIARINPFRYRGYYYDTETGFYYLQSRYYDPTTGRFINGDSLLVMCDIISFNLFIYCNNNPISYIDMYGLYKHAVFYDNRSSGFLGWKGTGFRKQGKLWVKGFRDKGDTVDSFGFDNISTFVRKWNSAATQYDKIFILAHGSRGSMDCSGQRLLCNGIQDDTNSKSYRFYSLNSKNVDYLYLFSCNGATCYNNTCLAYGFAEKTGADVFAVRDGKVNIDYWTGSASNVGGCWCRISFLGYGTKKVQQPIMRIVYLSPIFYFRDFYYITTCVRFPQFNDEKLNIKTLAPHVIN